MDRDIGMRAMRAVIVLVLGLIGRAADAQAPAIPYVAAGDKLTAEEISAFALVIKREWNPSGHTETITVHVQLNRDGTLAVPPQVVTPPNGPHFAAAANSATQALKSNQPYRMFKPGSYESWKDFDIVFDPKEIGPKQGPSNQGPTGDQSSTGKIRS
jgi:hypothetical protein